MSDRFHIRRIRLINFHNFVDETLAVRKNLFLIGDNQSGKTTVLDAVHFALSAGVEMEFNAAARFGPRTEAGRNLASIVLRYDLERDVAQRGPSVMYSAIEIANGSGATHTFGAGAFATSLDAQPDAWGFVARDRALEEVGLCVDEPDGVRHRPRDRQELEELLGRGAVLDKGRYRTAVAQLLFRDREAYVRALELVSAGKAYREMVARARNLDDLFIGLLPPPAEAEFEEVRSALRAIEGIGSDLADLESELMILRRVIEKLQETRRETEKIARYRFVGAELERRNAAVLHEAARKRAYAASAIAEQAEEHRSAAASEVTTREAALRALQASEGATLLAREEEARRDTVEAARDMKRAEEDLAAAQEDHQRAAREAARTAQALDEARTRAVTALRSVETAVREHLEPDAVVAVGALAEALAGFDGEGGPSPELAARPLAALQLGFEAARDAAASQAGIAEGDAARLHAEAAAVILEAEELHRRAEILPDLPGYAAVLDDLATHAGSAVPLYRLFALAPDGHEALGGAIECLLGPRLLGAIVVPPSQHAAARSRVIAHGCGVEVIDPAECRPAGQPAPEGTLPAALSDVAVSDLSAVARFFLEQNTADIRVLRSGAPRGDAERALWEDGHIYEHGAESRVDLAPPRFLGAEARARAAAEEERRLRDRARDLTTTAERREEEAAARREAAAACRQSLKLLGACEPQPLVALVAAVASGRTRVHELERELRNATERVERARTRFSTLERRHAELAEAVDTAGVSDLRERIAGMELDLEQTREKEKGAIDRAGRARTEAQERAGEETRAAGTLEQAYGQVEVCREALLPLVEPRYRVDVDDYTFRIMRGNQIRAENVAELVGEADRARARAFQWLDSSDGVRNERLWQRYAFRIEEAERDVRDQAGRPVEQVFEEREAEVHSLHKALDERTRDLLERVVMAGLVRRLQGQVRELHQTIQGINGLAADLRFGTSRFQFSLRKRPEFQRLLELLREQSVLQPALREELRDFFQARLDDLRQAREGEVPEILDYRRWFEYMLQVQSRSDDVAQDLPRQRLRFGSTGEQAVPTYLLVIAVASLLYDRTDARLRLLLLDEAFLGIDAGRREVLMQFADRAGVDLVVATPELDGVTPALAASSTLFVEKTPEQDVFVSDYHWERPDAQLGLFDRPAELKLDDLVIGASRHDLGPGE